MFINLQVAHEIDKVLEQVRREAYSRLSEIDMDGQGESVLPRTWVFRKQDPIDKMVRMYFEEADFKKVYQTLNEGGNNDYFTAPISSLIAAFVAYRMNWRCIIDESNFRSPCATA